MISWLFAQVLRIAAVQANKRYRLGTMPYEVPTTNGAVKQCDCPTCALMNCADELQP